MQFVKLNKNFELTPYKIGDITLQIGTIVNGIYRGIRYFKIDSSEAPELFELIPNKFRDHFFLSWVEITCTTPIHIDAGPNCAINIYHKTGNETTNFYKSISDDSIYYDQSNHHFANSETQEKTQWFNNDKVELISKCQPKKEEAWLLDTKVPHSVQPESDPNAEVFLYEGKMYSCNIHRTFVQLFTTQYTFKDVTKMLQYTGYVDILDNNT